MNVAHNLVIFQEQGCLTRLLIIPGLRLWPNCKEGNARFVAEKCIHPNLGRNLREKLVAESQRPVAAVLALNPILAKAVEKGQTHCLGQFIIWKLVKSHLMRYNKAGAWPWTLPGSYGPCILLPTRGLDSVPCRGLAPALKLKK